MTQIPVRLKMGFFFPCSCFFKLVVFFLFPVMVFAFSPGYITIDGHDIRDLNPYWLRSHIGTVSQVIHQNITPTCDDAQANRNIKNL